jgi:hypothetical protein
VLTIDKTGDYKAWNLDFLLEKRIGAGAVSVEAAYYNYRNDDVILAEQGKAWSTGLAYVFNLAPGQGKLQPFVQFQKFKPDNNIDVKQSDIGLNYIIDGYNAQLSARYSKTETVAAADQSKFVVALQVQY